MAEPSVNDAARNHRVSVAASVADVLTAVSIARASASPTNRSDEIARFFDHMRAHAKRFVEMNPLGDGVCVTRDTCNFLRHVFEVCTSELDATERDLAGRTEVSIRPRVVRPSKRDDKT